MDVLKGIVTKEDAVLGESETPLADAHDLVMFDLDGVVYVSGHAVADVAEHVARLREEGRHVAFVTNNASRTPEQVADKLRALGVAAKPTDVVTSAQAAARLVAERHGPGARVLMLGGAGLAAALAEEGVVVASDGEDVVAVVSGYGPDVLWRDIMKAATLVRGGVPYVASNADLTVPTARGLGPGHGVLVRAISGFAGVEPEVAGKPRRPLMDETVRRVGGQRPLMVGDRLDTDIEGARSAGIKALLVLTGVTWLAELAAAQPHQRPDYIAPGTEGLFESQPAPAQIDGRAVLGGWDGCVVDGRLAISGSGTAGDWWRVAAVTAWRHLDTTGVPVEVSDVQPPGPARGGLGR